MDKIHIPEEKKKDVDRCPGLWPKLGAPGPNLGTKRARGAQLVLLGPEVGPLEEQVDGALKKQEKGPGPLFVFLTCVLRDALENFSNLTNPIHTLVL